MRRLLDELDASLLRRIAENPGINIMEAVRPFLRIRSEPDLRYRLKNLEVFGHITMRRSGNKVLLFVGPEEEP